MATAGLHFSIYPLSLAGTPTGVAVGPEDNPAGIRWALATLRGAGRLIPRTYLVYTRPEATAKLFALADQYACDGLLGDLCIGILGTEPDLDGWLAFVRGVVARYGHTLDALQITNEPNLSFMEGANPRVLEVLVQGILAAKAATREQGLALPVGFGSVPDSDAAVPGFWQGLAMLGGAEFVDALDYVAHNCYIDVFEDPLAPGDIPAATERILRRLREVDLVTAGIPPTVPIRIGENGWPTGKNPLTGRERPAERQAEVLDAVVRTVHNLRDELNITHYAWFGLRDADSTRDDFFHQFGLLRDDYSPKPAFQLFQRLIRELGC